jgi:Transglycosylase-like domain
MRTHRTTSHTTFTLSSIAVSLLVVAVATGTVLTLGASPAVAGGSIRSHPVDLAQPAFRSVVVGASVVSLATLDLPGPVSVPTVPTTTTTTTTTAPPPPTPTTTGPPTSPLGGVWAELRQCESGGNYATNTGNGYYGAYQFSATTWHGLGFTGLPSDAPPAVQDEAAVELQARSGWGQWPACSEALGLT